MTRVGLLLALLLQLHVNDVCHPVAAEQMTLRMMQPVNGTAVTTPVYFQALLAFYSVNTSDASLCVEIDEVSIYCNPFDTVISNDLLVNDLALGEHTSRLIVRTSNDSNLTALERAVFTLVDPDEYFRRMRELPQNHEHQDLLAWARTYEGYGKAAPAASENASDSQLYTEGEKFNGNETLLVVGVKTNLIDHFAKRQAIRETWANKTNLLPGIEVVFVGCRLNMTRHSSTDYLQAINFERQLYGDLLTDELDCEDSYHGLVNKSTELLHYVTMRERTRLPLYVMMADDDIYVRLNDLAHYLYTSAPRTKYYAGQVLAEQFGHPRRPIRDSNHKNYLSKSHYPMSELPPFACGGHYILSLDCAQFIVSNTHDFRGVGTLEDVSVALWLRAMQVHPLHFNKFKSIYTSDCDDQNLMSYGDLSVIGIQAIHKNFQSGRDFCHGFNRTTWTQTKLPLVNFSKNQLRSKTQDTLGREHGIYDAVQLQIAQPVHGTAVTSPIHFHGRVEMQDIELLNDLHNNGTAVCVEVDGILEVCKLLSEGITDMIVENISFKSHLARLVLVSSEVPDFMIDNPTKFLASSDSIEFTVVDNQELRRRLGNLNRLHEPQDLLSWARSQVFKWSNVTTTVTINQPNKYVEGAQVQSNPNQTDPRTEKSMIVIGVKTSVVFGFGHRQAIRETWANKDSLPNSVRVVFVGCQPDASLITQVIREAIELEKRQFGDLLTHELDCVDRYSQLANKTKEFLRFVTQTPNKFVSSSPQYVMIADEDVYLDVNELVAFLILHAPSVRYYVGQVQATQFDQVRYPIRDPTHKNYLSEIKYPLKQLPPFATGAHYVLSFDCAQFIGMNHHELQGFGALDDVSVAYWMLALQVHPVHLPAMKILQADYYDLNDSVISLADLSPTGIREIHENLLHKRHFCHGLNLTSWSRLTKSATATTAMEDLRRDSMNSSNVDFMFTTDVNLDSDTNQLIISTKTQLSLTIETDSVSYCPSTDLFESYCEKVYHGYILIRGEHSSPQTIFCDKLRQQLVQAHSLVHINSARLALWNHNLQTRQGNQPPVLVVYSNRAKYASTVLECLFASVFTDRHALVLNETEFEGYQYQQQLRNQSLTPPDAAVFAVIDGVCDSTWTLECGLPSSDFLHRYGATNATLMMMIAGEPWDVATLDERVLLLSTISARRNRGRHIYLPVASTSFGERMHHSPMRLLTSQGLRKGEGRESGQSRRFCIYLYARCDRPQREYMFDLLDAIEPVDAPGVCQGARHAPDSSRRERRYHAWYNDEAVDMYERYKFVIAFENEQEPGYVTEKLANAFLAGSIPVYLGHSETVTQIFNVKSFIDCGQFRTLRDCADRVQEVHQSPELYAQMRHESAVANVSAFYEAFSWHPDVPSGFLSDELAKYFSIQRVMK